MQQEIFRLKGIFQPKIVVMIFESDTVELMMLSTGSGEIIRPEMDSDQQ
jgi:hypothetical protein